MTEVLEQPNIIETQLHKQNITEAVIAKLKADYLPLKINGVEDKVGYKTVYEARKNCKTLRVMASKVCKDGREDAVRVQKEWITAEKNVTGQISQVEDHLEGELSRIDTEKENIRLEAERIEKERLQYRIYQLTENGCSFDGAFYAIDNMKIPAERIKEATDDEWEVAITTIKEKHGEILAAQAAEAKRLADEQSEQERLRLAEQERMNKEREELAKVKAEQDKIAAEQASKEKELADKQSAIEQAELDAKAARIREEQEKQAEIKRLQDIEDANEAVRLQAIEHMKREQERAAREKEEQRLEAERQAALRPDKEKLLTLSELIGKIQLPEVSTEAAQKLLDDVRVMIGKMQSYILVKTKNL